MLANGVRERGELIRFRCWLGRVLRTPDRSLHSDSGIKTAAGIPEREAAHARELKDGGVGDGGSALTAEETVYCLQNEMKNGRDQQNRRWNIGRGARKRAAVVLF